MKMINQIHIPELFHLVNLFYLSLMNFVLYSNLIHQ